MAFYPRLPAIDKERSLLMRFLRGLASAFRLGGESLSYVAPLPEVPAHPGWAAAERLAKKPRLDDGEGWPPKKSWTDLPEGDGWKYRKPAAVEPKTHYVEADRIAFVADHILLVGKKTLTLQGRMLYQNPLGRRRSTDPWRGHDAALSSNLICAEHLLDDLEQRRAEEKHAEEQKRLHRAAMINGRWAPKRWKHECGCHEH